MLIGGNWNCLDDGRWSFRFHGLEFFTGSIRFGLGRPHRRQRRQNGLLHRRIGKISQVTALREDRQLFRAKRGVEPGQILVRQEKIVLIDDDADVRVGAQAGVIRPQVAGFFQRCRRGEATPWAE